MVDYFQFRSNIKPTPDQWMNTNLPTHPPTHAPVAINQLELNVLQMLQYDLQVSSSLYAKYFFEIRTLYDSKKGIKGGSSGGGGGGGSGALKGTTSFPLKPLTRIQARRLEARSSSMSKTYDTMSRNGALERKSHSFIISGYKERKTKGRAVLS